MDWLSFWGNVASIVGLLVTGYVAWTVRSLRKRYVRRIMLKTSCERFRDVVRRFGESISRSEKQELRGLAGQLLALSAEIPLHFSSDLPIEFPLAKMTDVVECGDGRTVLSRAKDLQPLLDSVVLALELAIEKEEWGRDDG